MCSRFVSITFTGVALLPGITSLKLSAIKNTVLAVTRSTSFIGAVTGDPPAYLLPELKRNSLTVALVRYDELVGILAVVFMTTELNLNCGFEFVVAVHVPLQMLGYHLFLI